jgi:hypothetical protein
METAEKAYFGRERKSLTCGFFTVIMEISGFSAVS